MTIYLNVGFAQKDIAKAAGAKWDANSRRWYYPGDDLPESLRKFSLSHNPTMTLRCSYCGQTGKRGSYPFSTAAHTGRCDDCL